MLDPSVTPSPAGALVSVLINLFKRSPVKPTETLIDFNVAIALTPVVLVSRQAHLVATYLSRVLTFPQHRSLTGAAAAAQQQQRHATLVSPQAGWHTVKLKVGPA
jgi:hypothetical protein